MRINKEMSSEKDAAECVAITAMSFLYEMDSKYNVGLEVVCAKV